MKIYSKSNFIAGLIGLAGLALFGFGMIDADWWQWALTAGLTVRCLYTALTKSGSRREKYLAAHYKEAAAVLHGKHHALKTNLPWVLAAAFFAVALVLRFVFEVWLPVWIWCVFVLGLTVSAFYSIGIQQSIIEHLDDHVPQEEEPEP